MKKRCLAQSESTSAHGCSWPNTFGFSDCWLGRRFFEEIHVLPPATILQYHPSSGELSLTRYWGFKTKPPPATISFDEAVEEGRGCFAGHRCCGLKAAADQVPLSGGLIAGASPARWPKLGRTPQTFTFGQPGCRDEHYARQIAGAIGAHHHFLPVSRWQMDGTVCPVHVQLTEGFHSWLHMHGINMLRCARVSTSMYQGLAISGRILNSHRLISYRPRMILRSRQYSLNFYHQKYSWPGLTYPEEYVLYAEPYRQQWSAQHMIVFRPNSGHTASSLCDNVRQRST